MSVPNPIDRSHHQSGFSLLEALIALAILAIAAAALIGASETHVGRVSGLEDRAVASWVAEEKLAELRIAGTPPVAGRATREMAGYTWQVDTVTSATADPALIRTDIVVSSTLSPGALATLSGFVDTGALR